MSAVLSKLPADLNGSNTPSCMSSTNTLESRESAKAGARFEPGAVYILLFDSGEPTVFHWGLYAALNEKGGLLYYKTDGGGSTWSLRLNECANVVGLKGLMAALKFSRLRATDNAFLCRMKERLGTVYVRRARASRDWLLEAVCLLANEGFISLDPHRTVVMTVCAEGDGLAETCFRDGSFKMGTSVRYK